MSTPTINTPQGLARVTTSLEHLVVDTPSIGLPELNEVIQLAETMQVLAPADDLRGLIDRIWSAREAIDKASAQVTAGPINAADLLEADPDVITERVLDSCRDRAARDTLAHQNAQHFIDALARLARTALKDSADTVVTNLRRDFTKHAKVIAAAAKADISEHTDTTELLEKGTPEQITAYRGLSAAVAGLEQVAALRVQMARVLGYGPQSPEVLCFVTGLKTHEALNGAAIRYDGPTEVMQYNQEFTGSTLSRFKVQRLGGRWLALVHAGQELRLNTADEAAAMYSELQAR